MLDEKYINFFEELKKFKEKQQKQKERGLNDYNLLTTVLNEHDEVRLHSRVIGSLLDVNGLHYQKELFLELFLEILKVTEFEFNIHESKLFLEYQNIDLYLTDGIKHIIIENKIFAGDQENQVRRYYEIIKNENKSLKYDDILVIYLSIDRKKPSAYSLGTNLTIEDNYILDNGEKIAIFKNINYKNEILNWLDNCLHEIQNITNLNESIQQYKNVVKKVLNIKNAKVGTMENKLLEMFDENKENFMIANSIYNNFDQIKCKIVSDFFSKYLVDYFTSKFNEIERYKDWEITVNIDTFTIADTYPIRIKKRNSNWKLIFQFGFANSNMNNGYYGISVSDSSVALSDFIKSNYLDFLKWKKNSKISLFWDYTPRKYTYATENLVAFKFEPEVTSQEYFDLFENTIKILKTNYNTTLEKINEDLDSFLIESKKL